jgi:hypothetical protein
MTREQFYDHWKNTHGPLCTKWLQDYGVAGYTQVMWNAVDNGAPDLTQ